MQVGSLVMLIKPLSVVEQGLEAAPRPVMGEIYTVIDIFPDSVINGQVAIELEEFKGFSCSAHYFVEVQPPMDLTFISELQQTIF